MLENDSTSDDEISFADEMELDCPPTLGMVEQIVAENIDVSIRSQYENLISGEGSPNFRKERHKVKRKGCTPQISCRG